jgi:TonB family protein
VTRCVSSLPLFALLLTASAAGAATPVGDDLLSGTASTPRQAPPGATSTPPILEQTVLCPAGPPQGLTVTVQLRFHVTDEGRVDEAIVLTSSGDDALDARAVRHAREKWRFKPATGNGRPLASWINGRFTMDTEADCTLPARAPAPAPDAATAPAPDAATAPAADSQ